MQNNPYWRRKCQLYVLNSEQFFCLLFSHPRIMPYIMEIFFNIFSMSLKKLENINTSWIWNKTSNFDFHINIFNVNVHKISAVRVDSLNNHVFWGFLTWTCYTANRLFNGTIIIVKAFFKKHLTMIVILILKIKI